MNRPDQSERSEIAGLLGTDAGAGRRRLRWLWLILVLGLGAALYAWRTQHAGDEAIHYRTEPAQRGDLVVTVGATGVLQPTNQVDVGSELSGIVESVAVDFNDEVEVGQVLARLDTSKFEAQVLQSRAALEAAKARVLQAQATVKEARSQLERLQRVRKLSGNKVPSQQDLDAAEAALDRAVADEASAKASVSQAAATLSFNETDLEKTVIRSPVNGIVLTRSVEPGQTVAASLQAPVLFTLAEDLTQMELKVDVDEADVGRVRAGQPASFTVDAYPNRDFEARITQVRYGATTVNGVVTYETVLSVDNSDLSLRPGMTATASITVTRIDDALLVPNAALRFQPPLPAEDQADGGIMRAFIPRFRRPRQAPRQELAPGRRARVWVLNGQVPAPVPVVLGESDGVKTQISDGALDPDTQLIVDASQSGQ